MLSVCLLMHKHNPVPSTQYYLPTGCVLVRSLNSSFTHKCAQVCAPAAFWLCTTGLSVCFAKPPTAKWALSSVTVLERLRITRCEVPLAPWHYIKSLCQYYRGDLAIPPVRSGWLHSLSSAVVICGWSKAWPETHLRVPQKLLYLGRVCNFPQPRV